MLDGRRKVGCGQEERERAALPGALSTRISPPSRRAISRLIDSPSPVPPNLRLVVPSACWNASKISCCLSFGDADARVLDREREHRVGAVQRPAGEPPSPPRRRDAQRDAARLGELERVRQQVLEHLLQPLPVGVDRRAARPAHARRSNSSPFCSATGPKVRSTKSRTSVSVTSPTLTSIFPASTFDRSRMSLMSLSRSVPDEWIVWANSTCFALRFASLFSPSSFARISSELSGVRSSCDMFARNSDL